MTTEKKEGAAAPEVTADEFDVAFAEAIAATDTSGEPASGKPAQKQKVADEAAAATAATNSQVDADEKAAIDAAATKKTEEEAAAGKTPEQIAAETAAAKKAEEEAAAAGKTPEQIAVDAAAATKKAEEDAARKATEDAARKAADDAAKAAAATKKAAEDAEAEEKRTAALADPVLSEEHKKTLTSFETEWPDIAKAVKVQQEHAIAAIEARFARALTAIVQKMYDDIGPMAQAVQNVESNTFRAEVLKAHPDFDEVDPKLPEWIAKQPSYLVDALKKVYDGGSVQELTGLVSQYKQANGIGSQTSGIPSPASKLNDQATAAAKVAAAEKAAALAPVAAKRSTPTPQGQDPNDYDGGFAEAVAAMAAVK